MIGVWTWALIRRRPGRLVATSAGIAVAVGLLACIGSFLAAAQGSMTEHAARGVVVDWQVEVERDASPASILDAVRSTPGVRVALPVGYAQSGGFSTTGDGTTHATGPGVVLGIPEDYRGNLPGGLRTLAGADTGVLVAQQTAANLHVGPGDTVEVARAGEMPAVVTVDGVVDLPQADSLFQTIGAPVGAQPYAPPDNVLILGQSAWHDLFDPLAVVRPDLVKTQIHIALDRALPADPAAAFTEVAAAARHLEARSAGGALVGDNLGAALDAARSDAAYAQVLFLFLGLPAAVLAGLLTTTVVTAGSDRRRREQALLRARGASVRHLIRLAATEALVVAVVGSALGLGAAAWLGRLAFASTSFGASATSALSWTAAASALGLLIATVAVVVPQLLDMRASTVVARRAVVIPTRTPRWARLGLDFAVLGASGLLFWSISRNGYQLVLAPEGVTAISVSYWAFSAPALLWIGSGLLTWRISDLLLGRGHRAVGAALRPVAGPLSETVANSISRRRRPLARAIVLLAVTWAFAASTATFNATYQAQADADARLTNGADVTVTESPGNSVPPEAAGALAAVPGVRAVEPIQHRFAYVGADLQDLFGVNPNSIAAVTSLQDSYFQGGSATELMDRLAAQPDSLLVSAETVSDFQLTPGDTVNLRLPSATTHQLTTVPFHYVGVVAEFPTAPRDSFFVANAEYVTHQTGTDAVGAFLVDTGGRDTASVAARIESIVGTSARVTDIAGTRATVGSSLTAVNLTGLTRVELGFGFLLAAASGALVLVIGLTEKRRSFAIVTALGASPRQLRSFVVADGAVLGCGGLLAGAITGWSVSRMLVTVLSGVFDPPPSTLTVPWAYLAALTVMIVIVIAAVSAMTMRIARRAPLTVLREL